MSNPFNPILTAALTALRAEYTFNPYTADGTPGPDTVATHRLARTADCSCPEGAERAGAAFLDSLFSDFVCAAQNDLDVSGGDDARDIRRALERFEWHETADGAVPLWTHQKWQTFVEIGAYDEDVSDLVDSRKITGDDCANAAIYIIADRLLRALSEELADACDEVEANMPDEDATDDATVTAD
jgi:hypothetical protein